MSLITIGLIALNLWAQPVDPRSRAIDSCVEHLIHQSLPEVSPAELPLLLAAPEGRALRERLGKEMSQLVDAVQKILPGVPDLLLDGAARLAERRAQWTTEFKRSTRITLDWAQPNSILLKAIERRGYKPTLPMKVAPGSGYQYVESGGRLDVDAQTTLYLRPRGPGELTRAVPVPITADGGFTLEEKSLRLSFIRHESLYTEGPAEGFFIIAEPVGGGSAVALTNWEREWTGTIAPRSHSLGHDWSRWRLFYDPDQHVLRLTEIGFKITATHPRIESKYGTWRLDGEPIAIPLTGDAQRFDPDRALGRSDFNTHAVLGDNYLVEVDHTFNIDFDVLTVSEGSR